MHVRGAGCTVTKVVKDKELKLEEVEAEIFLEPNCLFCRDSVHRSLGHDQ